MSSSAQAKAPQADNLSSPQSQKLLLADSGDRSKAYAADSALDIELQPAGAAAADNNNNNDAGICLKPKMTLLNGCTVIVGSIIGSGIFVSPKGVLERTGSVGLSLSIWVLSGLYSLIGAYCFAELGCMIPKSGADYAYIMTSFGPFLAFIRLWIECMIVRPTSQAIVALTFAIYALKPFYPDCEPPNISVKFLAIICILVLTFVNCWSVKWSTFVQDIFTYGKLSALAIIILAGVYQLSQGKTQNFNFDGSNWDVSMIGLSFYSGLFAYNGWNYLNFVIEELIEPAKNLPKAIIISCVLVTLVYTMTLVAFHTTLTVPEILGAKAVAVTFANQIFGKLAILVPVFVAMSTFGGVNGILFTSSRLFYAGAQEKQMPSVLSMIQVKHLTPAPAVITICGLSLFYLFFDDIYLLIDYVGFASWLAIGVAVCCVPYLRYKHPEWDRPIKVNLIWPAIYILATIYILTVPALKDPRGTLMGVVCILTGIPVYFLFIGWKNKPKQVHDVVEKITVMIQKLMVVVPPEKKQN